MKEEEEEEKMMMKEVEEMEEYEGKGKEEEEEEEEEEKKKDKTMMMTITAVKAATEHTRKTEIHGQIITAEVAEYSNPQLKQKKPLTSQFTNVSIFVQQRFL